jgi:glycosyltransferase involved in cell wall biosynthesis
MQHGKKIMKILMVNNYFYERGGAEKSLFDAASLLDSHGHSTFFMSSKFSENKPYPFEQYFVSDVEFKSKTVAGSISALTRLYKNFEAEKQLEKYIDEIGCVDLAHINNIMYRIGPSIVPFFKKHGIPVVFHLRDYNLMCGAINLIANGKVCDACSDYRFSSAFQKRCKGLAGSVIIASTMFFYHKVMKYFDDVDVFISPSSFLKNKYHEMGFNKRIEVLPNFLYPSKIKPAYGDIDNTYVYFGRFSEEKGIMTLLRACAQLKEIKFKIIGTGPQLEDAKAFVQENDLQNVRIMGYMKGEQLYDEIRAAKAAIVPSEWYENNSKAILESMALGKPVIASNIGGNPESVREGETGYLFEPFNMEDLVAKILLAENNPKRADMGRRARQIIETEYNPEQYYQKLMEIYSIARGAPVRCHWSMEVSE